MQLGTTARLFRLIECVRVAAALAEASTLACGRVLADAQAAWSELAKSQAAKNLHRLPGAANGFAPASDQRCTATNNFPDLSAELCSRIRFAIVPAVLPTPPFFRPVTF